MTKALYAADFSNIEGRVLAWLAGESWKLQAFTDFDTIIGQDPKGKPIRKGPDLYKVAAAGIYQTAVEAVTAEQRQGVGKPAELALGFAGGVMAILKFARNYGIRQEVFAALLPGLLASSPGELIEATDKAWPDRGRKTGVNEKVWRACELVKLGWRRKNAAIESYWGELEACALRAVEHPNETVTARRLRFRVSGSFLFCQLPSGRAICYPYPRIQMQKMPWKNRNGEAVFKPQVIYKAVDQYSKKWEDKSAYGGLLVERPTQGVARDIMADAMLRVDGAGFPVLLTVHDEVVSEGEADDMLDRFMALILKTDRCYDGLPIAAEGWSGPRYRKG